MVAGVIGVWLGFPRADGIVGLLIAVVILGILLSSLRTMVRRLMDSAEPEVIDTMAAIARGTIGVLAVRRPRARWSGHRLEGDVEIGVPGELSVIDSHRIAEEVHHNLLHGVAHLDHAAVHVNPLVNGSEPPGSHELTDHHASAAAREGYLGRTRPPA